MTQKNVLAHRVRRSVGALAAAVVFIGSTLVGGPAQAAPATTTVTASTSAGTVYGKALTVNGEVRATGRAASEAAVRLVGLPTTSNRWVVLGETRTDSAGRYSISIKPLEQYRLKAEVIGSSAYRASSSPSRTVTVQPSIAGAMPSWGTFGVVGEEKVASGAFYAQLAGRRVKLEQLSGGVWKTVAQTYALKNGSFELSFLPVRAGTTQLRIVVSSGQGLAAKAGPVTRLVTVATTRELAARGLDCYGVASTLDLGCENRLLDGLFLPTRDATELYRELAA